MEKFVIYLESTVVDVEQDQVFDLDGTPVPPGMYTAQTIRCLVPIDKPDETEAEAEAETEAT